MDVAVEIPIDTCLSFFNIDPFIRGHHDYQHIWTSAVGEEYGCAREIENKQDKNAIAVVHEERVVGHIPMAASKHVTMFLSLSGSYLEAEVTGTRVNRGGGYGLEVPCKYCLTGQEKAIDWIKNKITSIQNEHRVAVNKCLVNK